ncbi:MAG: YhbY family RNA-binding protein [Oscillospiraceae bacterium]|nr:YhbY family RNA-binding protein [Oscillospiraceae bacterium]
MLTSKERAEFRTRANGLDTTLMVGKGGVTEQVIAEAEKQLESRELVKGRVLETAVLSAREACEAICAKTGADGIQVVGSKFVLYRKSKKLALAAQEKAARENREKKKAAAYNPVRAGIQRRRKQARLEREQKNEHFKQTAIQASVERNRQRKYRQED